MLRKYIFKMLEIKTKPCTVTTAGLQDQFAQTQLSASAFPPHHSAAPDLPRTLAGSYSEGATMSQSIILAHKGENLV